MSPRYIRGSTAASCVALVDCNSFYASCERLADKSLLHRPVAVLSSNDGCIIARTDEVKALGIPMGAPLFKWRDVLRRHNVVVRSANFDFYVDVSARIMRLLLEMAPRTEVYSIDEAFLDFSGLARYHDLQRYAEMIRARILDDVGVPVSVGVGPTKVLAKVANRLAKRRKTYVEVLTDAVAIRAARQDTAVGDVWGIGRRTTEKLLLRGIPNAEALTALPDKQVLSLCSVTELRVVRELRGTPAVAFETAHAPKKHIGQSRSFGSEIDSFEQLREAVSYFVMGASVKLRQQHSVAGSLYVFARTNPFRKGLPLVRREHLVRLDVPTDHTPTLIRAAEEALTVVHQPGLRYKKAGVLLLDIAPAASIQAQLFAPLPDRRRAAVGYLVDELNRRYGRHTVNWAVYHGPNKRWMPLSDYRAKPLDMHVTEEDRQRIRPWW